MSLFHGRLGLQQRVLPAYRVPFFDLLAASCTGGLSLFAGEPRPVEQIVSGEPQVARHFPARNLHFFSGPLYLCHQSGITDWLSEWDPDALIVEANPRYGATPSAVRWMHARGRAVLGWGLGAPPPARLSLSLWKRGWLGFLRQFDGLIAYSRRGAEEYAALGIPRERIFVAYNAVSPAPALAVSGAERSRTAPPSLLFVGRLQARKRLNMLLYACAQLDIHPRLVIVGDGPERAALERLAAEVYPFAQFAGEKHGAELEPYFAQADLFVLPGTGGLAVQQAMSHALPVVVARGDGTQDDLVRPANGWQIPPEDPAALLSALREALSDIPRLRWMGLESYRIVAEEINIGTMVEAFVDALNTTRRSR